MLHLMAKATVTRARTLRQSMPASERRLWALLRGSRLSRLKFRRQVPIGPYIADFLCLRHRLIVELDGQFHDAERDAARDAWLSQEGFRVLRFTNDEMAAPDRVLGRILEVTDAPPADL